MYQQAGTAAAAGTTGTLAATGMSVIWIVIAGFALIAGAAALMRIVPRFTRPDTP
ncbi:LPXTG cell wall anchor domain-containing protein [Phytoactinopolyspora mesophila]|uniref:LPXTG cell wall anchor domain-containing protein n=1 Tax=Phytoactinopolyspora mesophila TaxID=2650750 RepID=A0A7K3LZC8_9ACTN|nr:LPXTG cell wall anchor domain-containing protein [Phytoactinopolyspora mesophila]NDL56359.1 LPXTG cell wall anchor domain-containing protein [Phytoactinopolyspora mesophila]